MIKKQKNTDYLTIKESREIIKYNVKQMQYYEAQKRIKRSEAEYTAPMNDENNIVEIDDLHMLVADALHPLFMRDTYFRSP